MREADGREGEALPLLQYLLQYLLLILQFVPHFHLGHPHH